MLLAIGCVAPAHAGATPADAPLVLVTTIRRASRIPSVERGDPRLSAHASTGD
jgi:hypothetical protein